MDPLDAMSAATVTFAAVLDQVRPDQLDLPTPCEEWSVTDLLGHVVVADQIAVALLDGADADQARALWGQEFGDDVIDRCRASIDEQLTRIRAVEDWGSTVHHVIGDVPASQLLQMRTGDLVLHAWDLATAIGVDAAIPEELAAQIYEGLAPMADVIGTIGMFGTGPSGTVGEEAPVTVRLLDLTGRRP
jgi:uncharacterized protein (TIGR03086 family)